MGIEVSSVLLVVVVCVMSSLPFVYWLCPVSWWCSREDSEEEEGGRGGGRVSKGSSSLQPTIESSSSANEQRPSRMCASPRKLRAQAHSALRPDHGGAACERTERPL